MSSQSSGSLRRGVRHLLRLGFLWAIRYTPLPWRAKWWCIWLCGPKFLLSACALITDAEGRVLVLRSRYAGDWQLPGGCVERGERVRDALDRECREELGLEIAQPLLLGIFVDSHGLAQCAIYRCQLAAGPITLSEEHSSYAFSAIADLPPRLRRIVTETLAIGADCRASGRAR